MKLVIQIPCYNEADTLGLVISDLPTSIEGISEIATLVIDDGSSDLTSEVAHSLGISHIVRHKRNRGLAAAFTTGLATSLELGADIIVNTDGDHQYRGSDIEKLVRPIVEGRYDIVIGDRRPERDVRHTPTKRILTRVGRSVVSAAAGCDLRDPVSGFRALSRSAAKQTHLMTRFSYTLDSLLQGVYKGLSIGFVNIETNPPTRPSRLFRNLPQFVLCSTLAILRLVFFFHALRVSALIGAVLALAGISALTASLLLAPSHGLNAAMLCGHGLILLASLVVSTGLLADILLQNRMLLEAVLEKVPNSVECEPERCSANYAISEPGAADLRSPSSHYSHL